jgi:molybdopterin-containing oxidoreductase family iron-sulfur binding subunit
MSELIQINPTSLTGKRYWRSLDELAKGPAFDKWVESEFGQGAAEMLEGGSRRALLKLMAAGFGLAGLTACRRPVERILPHAKGVENYVHGKPLHYATVYTTCGIASGLLVESNDGRPTKIEGNPKHPHSLGATSAQAQASVLNLYDPDRTRRVEKSGTRTTWDEFSSWAKSEMANAGTGAGLRILSERSSSPTLAGLKAELLKKYPDAKWVEYDSISFDSVTAGTRLAFGQPLEPVYDYSKADVVVALDCDFLGLDARSILPVKQFSARRRVEKPEDSMNRLYAAEPNFTLTGAMADHRLRIKASEVAAFAMALARELNVGGSELKVIGNQADAARKFISALAKDLLANKGKSLVVAGPRQPAAVHALAAVINQALGNNGNTVTYVDPVTAPSDSLAEVKSLAADMSGGKVKTLVILGGNPVYSMPADLRFGDAIKSVAATVALTAEPNETWQAVTWRLPEANPLECWGDARALDGTLSVQQPLIDPLHGGRSAIEVVALLLGLPEIKGHALVRKQWAVEGAAGEAKWKKALYEGLVEGSAFAAKAVSANIPAVLAQIQSLLPQPNGAMEVVFYPGHSTWDGRFANNAWLQEAPDPMTKLVWDNAALISPATARKLSAATGDLLSIRVGSNEAKVPALVQPGVADDVVALTLGYGRSHCGRVGLGVGHRVEPLRTTSAFHFSAATVSKTGGRYELVTTQEHHTLTEPLTGKTRPIVRETTLAEYRHHPGVIEHQVHEPEPVTIFPDFDYSKGYQWGMAIDLNACIGCNACLVACQAENNIPVVGKDQVSRGREMHWIRMDRYFTGSEEDPQAVMQPMACQQCEKAPCESVCPVAATVHSPEGLNDMAYNRCVGTRYCANNCPYKVRRFNFLAWNNDIPEVRKMVFNPDVSVRMRGVMEKCNYCVQRIQEKKIEAKADNRRQLKDGEVMSACQQVCPAEAIVFGDINNPESRVSKMKKQQRDYALLAELNTAPRTTYLAKLRNPNPELETNHG